MTSDTIRAFRAWFWRPPRPHGAALRDRSVTTLELFYDLVYVVVISQAAHHLAEDISARTVAEFAVVFSMIWFAWINGALYHELHGRQDGRTRTYVFIQMGILALLAVFTSGAAGEDGPQFAVVYAALFAVMGWLWYSVRAQDEARYRSLTGLYVAGMAVSVLAILVSSVLPDDARLIVWGGFSVAWLAGFVRSGRVPEFGVAMPPTHSMVERFGLFTIIVLGELIFGVVDGLSHAEHDAVTIGTGLLGLFVAFGFWWSYFDIVGHRLPRAGGPSVVTWLLSHLPITMAIAGAGAAMTSLVVHAHDVRSPAETAWLIGGAGALGLLALVPAALSLDDARALPAVYRKIASTMATGAVAALVVAWLQPTPWVLALLLTAILLVVWLVAVSRFLRFHAWREVEAESSDEASGPAAG